MSVDYGFHAQEQEACFPCLPYALPHKRGNAYGFDARSVTRDFDDKLELDSRMLRTPNYPREQRLVIRDKALLAQDTSSLYFAETVFVAVFTLFFCALYYLGNQQLFPWAVLGMDLLWLLLRKPSLPVLYSAFLVGNEAASALILIVWLIGSKDVHLGALKGVKFDKGILLMALIILVVSFAQAWRAGTVANTVISAVYLCFVGVLAYACSQGVGYRGLLHCTRRFVVGEFVASLLICFRMGLKPGDAHFGTLSNAHFFGIFCLVATILIIHGWRRKEIAGAHATAIVAMLVVMMWFADAKSALGAGIICAAIFLLFWIVKSGPGTIAVFLGVFVFIFVAGSLALATPGAREVLTSEGFPFASFFSTYVYAGGQQNKFDYFMGTATQMVENGHIFYGYGLGTYGSRFANMLGYTYTARDPSAFNDIAAALFSSRMIPEYIPFASAYNADLKAVIQWLSAVLTYPFSSIVALIGETGLLGTAAMALVLRKLRLTGCSQVLVAMFIGICVTDLYFDRLQVIGLVIMAVAGLENLRRADSSWAKSEASH